MRWWRRLPIERAIHHLPHPLKPPVRPALPLLAASNNERLTGAYESQFQLRIYHILPFFLRRLCAGQLDIRCPR